MAGGSIFISYRREDAAGESGRLADHLTRRFGRERVFIDIDGIAPGADFVTALDRAVTPTTVVLVVIGRQWLTVSLPGGVRRLDDPADFVRREVATALERGARVVPVLVQNATMPSADALPPALSALATRQAAAIQHEEFTADADRLADSIAPFVGAAIERPVGWYARPRVIAAATLLLILISVGGWMLQRANAQRAAAARASAERSEHQRRYDAQVTVAEGQFARDQLSEALATLTQAADPLVDATRGDQLAEAVAMGWLRELRVPEGQSPTKAMAEPLALLDRHVTAVSGVRRADLLAHLGWATFLRLREGTAQVTPEAQYQEALALDPSNPYANVMLGHWLLWNRRGNATLDEARRHFRLAADAGRATDVVRRFALSALDNLGTEPAAVEMVRTIDEMRRRREALTPGLARAVWSYYYMALRPGGDIAAAALLAAVPPPEHLQTLAWAFAPLVEADESLEPQLRYWRARVEARSGDLVTARTTLISLQRDVRGAGPLRSAIDAALAEVTRAASARP